MRSYDVWGRDLSGTLDGAGGVFAMHNAQCIMHNSLDSCEGQPRPHSLCIVHYELCIDGPARPDSFCILHSAFCIDAGLYYYGYRYYSPELGRWITRDPIEEDGGDNLYVFCGNNGVERYDVLGREPMPLLPKNSPISVPITFKVWCVRKRNNPKVDIPANILSMGLWGGVESIPLSTDSDTAIPAPCAGGILLFRMYPHIGYPLEVGEPAKVRLKPEGPLEVEMGNVGEYEFRHKYQVTRYKSSGWRGSD